MTKKYSVTIDLTKIDKTKAKKREYTNKNGEQTVVYDYQTDVVILGEQMHKVLLEKDNRQLVKVGFIAEKSTKDANGNWVNGKTIGEVTDWREKKPSEGELASKGYEEEFPGVDVPDEVNPDDIPF